MPRDPISPEIKALALKISKHAIGVDLGDFILAANVAIGDLMMKLPRDEALKIINRHVEKMDQVSPRAAGAMMDYIEDSKQQKWPGGETR